MFLHNWFVLLCLLIVAFIKEWAWCKCKFECIILKLPSSCMFQNQLIFGGKVHLCSQFELRINYILFLNTHMSHLDLSQLRPDAVWSKTAYRMILLIITRSYQVWCFFIKEHICSCIINHLLIWPLLGLIAF
jgi:hypothetical protein